MEMRRKDRGLTEEETLLIFENGEYGVLSTVNEAGLPYGVPVNYVLNNNKILIHCAKGVGHKLDNIKNNPQCCFTVIGSTEILPEKFSTKYLSGIIFGKIETVLDPIQKREGLINILKKYSPEFLESGLKYIDSAFDDVDILELEILEISGKGRKK